MNSEDQELYERIVHLQTLIRCNEEYENAKIQNWSPNELSKLEDKMKSIEGLELTFQRKQEYINELNSLRAQHHQNPKPASPEVKTVIPDIRPLHNIHNSVLIQFTNVHENRIPIHWSVKCKKYLRIGSMIAVCFIMAGALLWVFYLK